MMAGGDLVTYVTVADEKFFLGAVALVNSLRIAGNPEPILVIDAGLSAAQRTFLSEACEVRSLAVDRWGALTAFLKPAVSTLGLEGTTVVLDSDMIVTSRLEPILAEAEAGKLCVFTDIEKDRYFAEWETTLGLKSAVRPGPYVNSGFVAFKASCWQDVISRWWELSARIGAERSRTGHWVPDDVARGLPFAYYDQDVLNAILMAEVDPARVRRLESALSGVTDWELIRIDDERDLRCSLGSRPVILLHLTGYPKPWFLRARNRFFGADDRYFTAYEGLMVRLLTGPDVPLRVPAKDVPLWLRRGPVARVARHGPRRARSAALSALRLLPDSIERTGVAVARALVGRGGAQGEKP